MGCTESNVDMDTQGENEWKNPLEATQYILPSAESAEFACLAVGESALVTQYDFMPSDFRNMVFRAASFM